MASCDDSFVHTGDGFDYVCKVASCSLRSGRACGASFWGRFGLVGKTQVRDVATWSFLARAQKKNINMKE
jgi:hypothetical protein